VCVCEYERERGSVLRNAKTETLPHSRISPPHAARSVTYLHYLVLSIDRTYIPPPTTTLREHLHSLVYTKRYM